MKMLVTGGAGFIGSHLVDALLVQGYEVIVVDNFSTGRVENLDLPRGKVELVEADIAKPGEWQQCFKDVSAVFHLAALADIVPSIRNPRAYYEANVNGTFNVVEASVTCNVNSFVYAASSSSYGLAEQLPTPESANIDPQYPYALTKFLGEEVVIHWAKVYGLPATSLRFFNVYGPRSRTSGTYGAVFGVFLAQKLANKPFTVVGDGEQTRDFTYVSDVVEAIIIAAGSGKRGKIYNVGSGKTISVNRLVELLDGPKTYIPKRPGEPDCTFADISLIKKELGWEPKVSIEEGVSVLLDSIDYWREAPVWTPESIAKETEDWFDLLS